jgi:4-amino-4-deoxy-L-arabinose transferase-like glycosyltransferase
MMYSSETGTVSPHTVPAREGHPSPDIPVQGLEKQDGRFLLLLCALCLVVFFFQLGDRPIWDIDEGKHASTSKDMVLTGDWITPRVNGINFYDKTPLFNWFAAISFIVFGFTEFAARFPAALLGLATVLVTYLFGRRLFDSRAGLLAGVVLATSPEVILLSRTVVHDISLTFFISLALYFFYSAFANQRRRRIHLLLSYAAMGFAVLAKGPIGLLLPGMIIGLFLLAKGRLNFLKEMALGWGALIFLIVAAPWYVLISVRNPDYLSYFFLKQNLGNFLSKTQARHPRPFYYFVPVLLGGMLPWSFLVPLAFLRPLERKLQKIDDGVLFLLCWFLVIFLFFSAANSKLGTYILPALPAAALLIGRAWHEIMTAPTPGLHRGAVWSLAPVPVLFLTATVYVFMLQAPVKKIQMQYGMNLSDLYGFSIALTAIVTTAFLFLAFRYYRAAFTTLAATFVVGIIVVNTVFIPLIDPYRSTKGLAKEMDTLLPPGERLVFFWTIRDSALFYTNRLATVLTTEEQLLDHLASNKRVWCVIERDDFEKFDRAAKASVVLRREGDKLLISNKPMQ